MQGRLELRQGQPAISFVYSFCAIWNLHRDPAWKRIIQDGTCLKQFNPQRQLTSPALLLALALGVQGAWKLHIRFFLSVRYVEN